MIDSDAYLTELTWQMLVEGYLPPVNEVWVKVICLQVCVCPHGVLSQHALQVVSQHALQQVSRREVSRPTAKGEVEWDLVQAHSQGEN